MKDYYWLNKDSRLFLERDYLEEGKTPEQRVRDIALNAQRILGIKGFADKFEGYMKQGFYSLSTPVWINFGTKRGLPVSCFNSYIPDSIEGMYDKASEVAIMSKQGGGTSGFFGEVRHRGAPISRGGKADGPVRYMEIFDNTTEIVSQGSSRRGSFAAYLPIDHPDIMEFLQIQDAGHAIQKMSIGVTITDKWMKELINENPEHMAVWERLIRKRYETGYPYIFFTDNANKNKPQVYKDNRIKIHGSNLCVTGDQRVVSNRGLLTAKELFEQGGELVLFDNKNKVTSSPMQLIEKNAEVFEITLANGMKHKVTPYHKVKTNEGNKECRNLKIGDKVAIQTNKGVFGSKSLKDEAFLLGIYQSDGTQYKDIVMIDIWENDFDLENDIQSAFNRVFLKYGNDKYEIKNQYDKAFTKTIGPPKFRDCVVRQSKVKKKRLTSKALKKSLNFEKGYVPSWIWESDEETQWAYVKGLLFADGTVHLSTSKGNPIQIAYADINKGFLEELQILFANLGLQASIRSLRKAGKTLLPDGKGGHKLYKCKDCFRLIIGNKNDALWIEAYTGFLTRKGVFLGQREYRDNTKKFYKVKEIRKLENEDVYCCKVNTDEHHWVCNGIITHNCSEIFLPSSEDESFVCVLSSINLFRWDEIKETDAIETMVYFLDAVCEEFIQKTEGMRFMGAPHKFAKRHRALGMGVLGWHSLLQSKGIPFEGLPAQFLNNEVFSTLRERADKATEELAKLLGEPELLRGYGRRNTTTMAVAPTTSSSFILGQVSSGIEPLNSNYFVKGLAKGKFTFKNPQLRKLLTKYKKNDSETWKSILLRGGSVQHLEFLTEEERSVFKTFGEISQKDIVIQAAQRQRYIDQGQSLNVMIPPKTDPEQVSDLLIEGWKMGVKSFYYQRSANPSQELSRNIMECASCGG